MATTSHITVDEGSTTQLPTYDISEDAATKKLSRSTLNKSDGTEMIGQQTAANSIPVILPSATITTLTPPTNTGYSTSANQSTANTSLSTIATNTGNIPASPATSGKQDTGNTSLGNIDTSTAASKTDLDTIAGAVSSSKMAVKEADGDNVVLGAKADAKSTATDTTAITIMSVLKQISASTQAPPSQAVTNAGTFLVQAALNSGSNLIGKVGIDQTTPGTTNAVAATNFPTTLDTNSGTKSASTVRVVLATDQPALTNKLLVTPDSVALPANQSVNVAQINGVTPLMGAGNTGTGSPRVTIATDDVNLAAIASAVHTEDVASANADKGMAVMAVRDDTLNSTSGTEGDYELLHTTADGALWVTQAPSTSNGWLTFMATTADGSTALTSTAQAVKASAGTLGGWYIYNPNTTAIYVVIYNTAQGSVTVGTTNPQIVLPIPALSAANQEFSNGINFTTAMAVAATTTGGGNTAPTTALECNLFYK